MINKNCLYCKEPISGRLDKIYCSHFCKSSYHYEKNRDKPTSLFKKIDNQLKLNRRLLKNYNKAGMSVIKKEILLGDGFNPKHFTHYWKNGKGDVYLFCYEYGFLEKKEKKGFKYVLVQWQDYMN